MSIPMNRYFVVVIDWENRETKSAEVQCDSDVRAIGIVDDFYEGEADMDAVHRTAENVDQEVIVHRI